MTGFRRGYSWSLFSNLRQLKLFLNDNGSEGFITLKDLNETRKQSQMFTFCDPHIPGEWMTTCLTIQAFDQYQNFSIFKDGKFCYEKIFDIKDFGGFLLPSSLSVLDM